MTERSDAPMSGHRAPTERGSSGLIRSTGVISAATMISRVLGFVRDSLIASVFPIQVLDPFLLAFRIPNTLRRLFAEGALSAAFVPVFVQALKRDSESEIRAFAGAIFRVVFLVLLAVSLLGVVFAPQINGFLGQGFGADSDLVRLTVSLGRIMFPYILFVGLAALAMGMLNALGRFFVPALSPTFLNLSMIAGILLSGWWGKGNARITWVAWAVLWGGLLQCLAQWLDLRGRLSISVFEPKLSHPRIREVAALFLPAVFGQAAMQINVLVDSYFACTVPGANTYLYYANRLMQFPLGVYGIAVATASFPRLSGHVAVGDEEEYGRTLSRSFRALYLVMIPASFGLFFFGNDITGLLFNHGRFAREGSLYPTVTALWAYSAGLLIFALVKVAASALYAMNDTKRPMLAGFACIGANVVLDAVLIQTRLRHTGLALATTVSSGVNLALLLFFLGRRVSLSPLVRTVPHLLTLTAVSGLSVWLCRIVVDYLIAPEGVLATYLVRCLVGISLAGGSYLVLIRMLFPQDYKAISRMFH
jgi:putative peptidoglycan lipid II flippase